MSNDQLIEYYDELDIENLSVRSQDGARISKRRQSKKQEMEARLFVRANQLSQEIKFTYKAARFEDVWLFDSLNDLTEHLWISDVLRKAKAGKEASVYLCKPGPAARESKFVAAKVYRPRMLRNLKNDQQYRDGRTDLDAEGKKIHRDADVHAIAKRSTYGEELRHQSWIAHEFQAMEVLFAAGADIPRPYARTGNTIAMEFVGDELGSAPTLNEVVLERNEAHALFERTLHNIDILLAHGYVHGDLSAYNILYWEGDIKLIDFPQVVLPRGNSNAFPIFARDVTRVCEYFIKQGVDCDPRRLARDLWAARGYPERKSVDPRLLDPEDNQDRRLWEQEVS
jgi:RIO kinase 1